MVVDNVNASFSGQHVQRVEEFLCWTAGTDGRGQTGGHDNSARRRSRRNTDHHARRLGRCLPAFTH